MGGSAYLDFLLKSNKFVLVVFFAGIEWLMKTGVVEGECCVGLLGSSTG